MVLNGPAEVGTNMIKKTTTTIKKMTMTKMNKICEAKTNSADFLM